MTMRDRETVREKLDEIDSWRGMPNERRRCCMPTDYGKIQALCWVLGMSLEEWDNSINEEDPS